MTSVPAGDRAQTESIGSILLVAVIVVTATTAGAYYIASTGGGPEGGAAGAGSASGTRVEFSLDATTDALRLSHNGGSAAPTSALEVTVTTDTAESTYGFDDGRMVDGDADGQFEPGETWRLSWSQSGGTEVTVTVVNNDTDTLLLRETVTIESPTTSTTESGTAEGAGSDDVTVDAGPARTVSGERGSSVVLNGSASSTRDEPLDYQWAIVGYDGLAESAVDITNATAADATFEVRENVTDRNHSVVVELTASDGTVSNSDKTTVTVEAINRPPVADAGEDESWDGEGDGERGDGGDDETDALTVPVRVQGAAVVYPPQFSERVPVPWRTVRIAAVSKTPS